MYVSCDTMDCSLPGSSVLVQAGILEREVKSLSCVQLFATPWAVAYQAPSSMGFSRQEYWSGLPFLSPGDLPDPGIKPRSPSLEADALPSELPGKLFPGILEWVAVSFSNVVVYYCYKYIIICPLYVDGHLGCL